MMDQASEREHGVWETRKAPVWVIVAVVAVTVVAAPFFQFVVFAHHWLTPISHATRGLIQPTLIATNIVTLIQVVALMIYAGGLRASDIGFVPRRIWPAVIFTIVLWAVVNAGIAVNDLISHSPMTVDDGWAKMGALRIAGSFIGQIFGNTPSEEMAFRGFLLVQLALVFRPFGQTKALVAALIVSQLIFTLSHIPLLIVHGHNFQEICFLLTEIFVLGSLFAIVYLATNNLFVAMGTHTLANDSMQVLSGSTAVFHEIDAFSCAALAMSLLWWWWRSRGRRPQPQA
jgi:uncharacterized protein